MKRTIEKLHQERRDKEDDYQRRLDELEKTLEPPPLPLQASLEERLRRLEDRIRARETLGHKLREAVQPLGRKDEARAEGEKTFRREVVDSLRDLKDLAAQGLDRQTRALAGLREIVSLSAELGDARDKEWDALGSNHVGLIFKSMEWRVDALAAAYSDVQILMKKFILLEDQLTRLLARLEENQMPSPADVTPLLEPLRDWRYAGFENRFRGTEGDVRAQQIAYAGLFKKGGRVLDLGCGRGEFLELLKENGVEGEGLDLNQLMVEACLDKGLNCRRDDLLQDLASREDGSLDGIFSSQVIEHLPPSAIQRLVSLARAKLRPAGLLVLETVNPLSLFALVNIYFLDLSHVTPVHPLAARFLLETAGFEKVEVRYSTPLERERLQSLPGADPVAATLNRNIDALNDLLFAPPNYAILGTRP
jgi:SAM-dependent methyltransferase